jgi:cellulose synthase (UDP-forming)
MSPDKRQDPRLLEPDWDASRAASRQRLRLLILIAIPLAAWYFGWLLQPERIGHPLLYGMLAGAELFNLIQAVGFWWTISRNRSRPAGGGKMPAKTPVDVFVPVYDEPVEIVEPTVRAAARIRGADVRVHLLDDGASAEMRELAERVGVAYLRRDGNAGAKAGNINAALGRTEAPFVLILDSDHVPRPNFLERTLDRMADPQVAYVQTPQYYANARKGGIAAGAWAQQALFFGAIARGKAGHDAMFCCGTNVLFRREALISIGGFPTNSVTEDFELSLRLGELGWRSHYVPEVLAVGLGPEDMSSWVSQQQRWARGCLGAIASSLRAKLPTRTRVQYLLSSMYFLSGWTLLVYMSFPVIKLLTGEQPIAVAGADQFLIHFAPYFGVALLTVAVAGAGAYSFAGFALAASGFWIHIQASIRAALRRPAKFVVTPKQGSAARQPRAVLPTLTVIAILSGAAVWGLLADRSPSTLNNVAFAGLHVSVLVSGAWWALRRGPASAPAPEPTPAVPQPEPAPAAAQDRSPRRRRGLWPRLGPALAGVAAAGLIAAGAGGAVSVPDDLDLGIVDGLEQDPTEAFFDGYVTPEGRVVRRDQGGDTVSEGQAYAMLLAAGAGEGRRFQTVWAWTREHLQRNDRLLSFLWRDGEVVDPNPAADADLDAAWALLVAAERFDRPQYRSEALRIGRAILREETTRRGRGRELLAGPWAKGKRPTINPSYYSPGAYAALARASGDRRWHELARTSRRRLATLTASKPALPPDWARIEASGRRSRGPVPRPGPAANARGEPLYSYDAIRVPLRYAAACTAANRGIAARLWPFLKRQAATEISPSYTLDGRRAAAGTHAGAIVAAAAAAAAADERATADELLDRARDADEEHPSYYGSVLLALGEQMLNSGRLTGCGPRGKER